MYIYLMHSNLVYYTKTFYDNINGTVMKILVH